MSDLGAGAVYFVVAYGLFLGGMIGYTAWLWSRRSQARNELARHQTDRAQASR